MTDFHGHDTHRVIIITQIIDKLQFTRSLVRLHIKR